MDLFVSGTATYSLVHSVNVTASSLTITDANASYTATGARVLTLTTAAASGLTLTAGSFTLGLTSSTVVQTVNTNVINLNGTSGTNAILTVGSASVATANSTLAMTAGSIGISTLGQLNIGSTTGAAAGRVNMTGGLATISGGNLTANTFNVSGGTFTESGGNITNTSTANFSGGTNTISGGTFTAAGITVGTDFSLNGGTLASSGSVAVNISAGKTLTMGGGTLSNAGGTIALGSSTALISGTGAISAGTVNGSGTITATGGTLDVVATVAGTNVFNVATGSVLRFDGTVGSSTINLGAATTTGIIEIGSATDLSNFSGTIANLDVGSSATSVSGIEYINLQGVTVAEVKVNGVATHSVSGSTNVLTLYSDAAATTLLGTVNLSGSFGAGTFIDWGTDSGLSGSIGSGTDLFLSTVSCYAQGSLILTDLGEVPVETLAQGDRVVTLQDGQAVPMPVQAMVVAHIDVANHPYPHLVAPIRIRAGAFGPEQPRRDLLVSPAHAMLVDGKLVPANLLINHMTIVQDLDTADVSYHHLELERHSVILAEGLESESYLDTGSRSVFDGSDPYPEFHVNAGMKIWEEKACAPLVIDAEAIAPIWHQLAARAESLGYTRPVFDTTTDADLYVLADGRRLRPIAVARGRHKFMLPAGVRQLTLQSRTGAPADLNPLTGDWRPLGVAVRSITLWDGDDAHVIPADHPGLTKGWHLPEQGNGDTWRWTTGSATIPVTPTFRPTVLEIDVSSTTTYVLARDDQGVLLAA